MNVPPARLVEGKKYFWDGETYPSRDAAAQAQAACARDGFETCMAEGEQTFLVYTRRVVRQVGDVRGN